MDSAQRTPRHTSTIDNQRSSKASVNLSFNGSRHTHHGSRWLHVSQPNPSPTQSNTNSSGGSVLADFVSQESGPIKNSRIYAAVRTEDQAQALSQIDGVNILQADLRHESLVQRAILDSGIDIVLHIASSIDQQMAENLINALGERRKMSGEQVFFVQVCFQTSMVTTGLTMRQSSVTSMYAAEGGWPFGEIKDSDNVYEKEKQIGGPNPVRLTNIRVVELAKEQGVTTFNVALPLVRTHAISSSRNCTNLHRRHG